MSRRQWVAIFTVVFGFLVLSGSIAMAAFKLHIHLAEVCRTAPIIVAGDVASVEYVGDTVPRRIYQKDYSLSTRRVRFTVAKVIKGEVPSNEIIVEYLGSKMEKGLVTGPLYEYLNPRERVVLLLKPKAGIPDVYIFENDWRSAVRISKLPSVSQLLAALPAQAKPDEKIAQLLVASMEDPLRVTVLSALEDLVNLKGKEASTAIGNLLNRSNDTVIKGRALEALLQVGDYSYIEEAISFVQSEPESDHLVLNAKRGISARMSLITKPDIVVQLYPLLKDTHAFARREVAYAVRKAKLRGAVPLLIEGLKDSDLDTRYQCLMGLAETLDLTGQWAPSKPLFEQNESEYINRWQTWWETEGRHQEW